MPDRGVSITVRGPDGRAQAASPGQQARQIRGSADRRFTAAATDPELTGQEISLTQAAVAFDFFRAAAKAAGRGGLDTAEETERVTRLLWSRGDALTTWLAGQEAARDE